MVGVRCKSHADAVDLILLASLSDASSDWSIFLAFTFLVTGCTLNGPKLRSVLVVVHGPHPKHVPDVTLSGPHYSAAPAERFAHGTASHECWPTSKEHTGTRNY